MLVHPSSPRTLCAAILAVALILPSYINAFVVTPFSPVTEPGVRAACEARAGWQHVKRSTKCFSSREKGGDGDDDAAAAALSSLDKILAGESANYLADEVIERLSIPFIPGPIKSFLVHRVIGDITSKLSPGLVLDIKVTIEADSYNSKLDETTLKVLDILSDRVAEELASTLDVPILNEKQEREAIRSVADALLLVLTTSKEDLREVLMSTRVSATEALLGTPEAREALAEKLCDLVDVPFLDEEKQEKIFESALDKCADALVDLLPDDVVTRLRGLDSSGLEETKDYLVSRIDDLVSLPFLSEEKEKWLVEKLVDAVVDALASGTAWGMVLENDEERKKDLENQRESVLEELRLLERRYNCKSGELRMRLEMIDEKLREVPV